MFFCFVLFFSFQYTEVEEWRKMGKAWEHLSHDVMRGGRIGVVVSSYKYLLRARFLPVKQSTCGFVNIWGLG